MVYLPYLATNLVVIKIFTTILVIFFFMKDNIFGRRLKELRLSKSLKIKDVAFEIGLSLMAYNHYEWGDREPSIDVLNKLCDYFDVSSDYLIGRTDSY